MRRTDQLLVTTFLTIGILSGCENAGHDRVFAVEGTGVVHGQVFFDWSGARVPGDSMVPVEGVGIVLSDPTTGSPRTTTLSGPEGDFRMDDLPVGPYHLSVDPATIPDTVQVVRLDTPELTVLPRDSVFSLIGLGFPNVSVDSARLLPEGHRIFVDGVAANNWETFGDSSLHILSVNTKAAIRVTRVLRVAVNPGDVVRIRAATGRSGGQPVLDGALAFVLRNLGLPPPEVLTTQAAASADQGTLDAAHARVEEATITDTASVSDGFQLTVDDGSGPLDILLDRDVGFSNVVLNPLAPGAVVTLTGILVPADPGIWTLKPRSASDITVD